MPEDKNLNFFGKYFRLTLIFIIFLELISFLGYLFPLLNTVTFFSIITVALILAVIRLEYGLYLILAELFIGSKGYLFYFEINGLRISLRLALFLVVLGVWIFYYLRNKKLEIKKSNLFWPLILLFLFIIWGVLSGFLRGNEFDNLFFDVNGWLYFGMVFIFFAVINSWQKIENILQILTASISAIALKTVILLFFFSHNTTAILPDLYRWVRETGVGEITKWTGNFYRIFFQSHLYSMVVFFIAISLYILLFYNKKFAEKRAQIFIILISSLTLIISFSRSFWLGAVVGLLIFYYLSKSKLSLSWKKIGVVTLFLTIILIIDIGIISGILAFPWPRQSGEVISAASLVEQRVTEISGEVAVSIRFDLLPHLWKKVIEHPVLGSGFGTTVSYSHPFVNNPEGIYTTYAFEFGYLDIWTKIGFFGLLAYFWLIWRVVRNGFKIFKNSDNNTDKGLSLGLILGLFSMLITNLFSPYLNHPLGIGYLILTGAIFEVLNKKENNNG